MIQTSSLRVLFPPKASPELQSSRFAQILTLLPRSAVIRDSSWIGEGPKRRDSRGISQKGDGNASLFEGIVRMRETRCVYLWVLIPYRLSL